MQKWEYLSLRIDQASSPLSSWLAARAINGRELGNWRSTPLEVILNQLGEDGWEMPGSVGFPAGNSFTQLIFKRPKP